MGERKRISWLVIIMFISIILVATTTIILLYRTVIKEYRAGLVETAQTQARLIEVVDRFDDLYSNDFPEGVRAATISQIIDSHANFRGFGKTGEFPLAERKGD